MPMNNGRITVLHTEASLGFGGLLLCQPGSRLGRVTEERKIPTIRFKMRSAYDPVAFVKILQLLKRERVDVIHAHSSRDAWLAGAAGKLLGVPVFRTRHLLTPIGGPYVYARPADPVLTGSAA